LISPCYERAIMNP
jgi:hypothetical protein